MNSWKAILATMVIFGTGVVTGGLLVRFTGLPLPQPPASNQPKPGPPASVGGMRIEFLRRAGRELNLSDDQRDRINKIFRDSQERTKRIMEPVAPQIREEIKRTRAEFVDVLTPEQRARFVQLARQQQQRAHDAHSPQNPTSPPAEFAPAPGQ